MRRNKINDRENPIRKNGIFDFGGKLMFYLKSNVEFGMIKKTILKI